MAKINSQKYIERNRAPRVQIEYDVQTNGAQKSIEIPFVMGVMANLSGKPKEALGPIEEREFEEIDSVNFDSKMKAIQPRAAFQSENKLTNEGKIGVDLTFESIDDFTPGEVAKRIPETAALLKARTELANLKSYLDGKGDAEKLLSSIMDQTDLLKKIIADKSSDENE